MNDTTFYRAFEDRHRGPRELIKRRLRVYLPFILPLRQIYDDCPALDLGCGRGEWLELASEAGFEAHGVDLDDGMLEACYERGLSVEKQDAIKALKALPDESQVAVSAFHLVEHIPFDAVQTLVKEALRVLKPAGLLIMETPNPENILVGTTNFYLDPTHQRPIPPQLLSFLPEHCGFSRTKILRLQEAPGLVEKEDLNIFDIIGGVSPDYAVVAQKDADKEKLVLFDDAFKKEYGLTIDNLAMRYDSSKSKIHQLETALAVERERSSHVQAQLQEMETQLREASELARQLEKERDEAKARIEVLSGQLAETEVERSRLLAELSKERDVVTEIIRGLITERERAYKAETSLFEELKHSTQLKEQLDQTTAELHEIQERFAQTMDQLQRVESEHQKEREHVEQLIREQDAATEAIHQLEAELSAERERVEQLAKERAAALSSELQGVYASWSWRLTYPLRQLNLYRRKFCAGVKAVFVSMLRLPRRLARCILEVGLMYVRRRPTQKARLKALLARWPRLQARLYAFAAARHASAQTDVFMPPASAPAGSVDLSSYPVSVRTIYRQLLACRSQSCQKEENA